ncbi:MAG: hypothetical protein ACE5H7_16210, partial [Acidiferrobacterales bacterium]
RRRLLWVDVHVYVPFIAWFVFLIFGGVEKSLVNLLIVEPSLIGLLCGLYYFRFVIMLVAPNRNERETALVLLGIVTVGAVCVGYFTPFLGE